jgi:hypothetical protein
VEIDANEEATSNRGRSHGQQHVKANQALTLFEEVASHEPGMITRVVLIDDSRDVEKDMTLGRQFTEGD